MKIKIKGNRYSIDWVYDETKEVEIENIWGLEYHWRGDTWHIVVVTKDKCSDGYYHYEVGHWVDFAEAVRVMKIPEIKIIKVTTNTMDNFKENLYKLMKEVCS